MKNLLLCCAAAALMMCTPPARAAESVPAGVPPQLKSQDYVFSVVGHLYRWYMDEVDVLKATGGQELNNKIWVRRLSPELDPGDRSEYGEIYLPLTGIAARVKRTDYSIPELDAVVKSDTFKIVHVQHIKAPKDLHAVYTQVELDMSKLRDYLFTNRNTALFPEGDLLTRLRLAVRHHLREEAGDGEERLPEGPQAVHFSPLSPVANELWVFWENGRMLIRFASDLDLANPKVWEHEELAVTLYDIDEQVVVSFNEVPGSNAYLTRDQVGRALFNCVILGKRVVLDPADLDRLDPAP